MNWRSFLTAYKKSIFIVLTPIIFIPLLLKDELTALSQDDICKLWANEGEDCDDTIARLSEPGNEPVMFKVIINTAIKALIFRNY